MRLAFLLHAPVQHLEGLLGHVDFAAHLDDFRDFVSGQHGGNIGNRPRILGNILTHGAITPRCSGHQPAAFVAQGKRQSVDLRLRRQFRAGFKLEKPDDAVPEITHIFVAERVVERQHGNRVAHLLELVERHVAHPLRRRILANEVRKSLLDGEVSAAQCIVFGIGNFRSIAAVIKLVVMQDSRSKPFQFARRLLPRHVRRIDAGMSVSRIFCHGNARDGNCRRALPGQWSCCSSCSFKSGFQATRKRCTIASV